MIPALYVKFDFIPSLSGPMHSGAPQNVRRIVGWIVVNGRNWVRRNIHFYPAPTATSVARQHSVGDEA